jgi:uncharacterized membrane protein YkvA (DUF1232 family)
MTTTVRGQAGEKRRSRTRGPGRRGQRGAARVLLRAIRHIPAYIRLLVGLLFDARVAAVDKALVVGAIAYVVSPIGFLSDVVPLLGELDDLFILTLALQHLVTHTDEQVLLDHWTGDPEELSDLNVGRILAAAALFLPRPLRTALRRRITEGAARLARAGHRHRQSGPRAQG